MVHYLIYIPSFAGGGAEQVAVMLADQFHKNGNKVSLVVNSSDGPVKSLLNPHVSLYELNPGSHFSSIFLFSSLLRERGPDYIYCWSGLCPLVGVLAASLAGMRDRVVISYQNIYSAGDPLGKKVTYWSSSLLSRLSHGTVCVSSDIQAELVDKFYASSKKLRVIHNPVDIKAVWQKCSEPPPGALLKYQEEQPFILAVGRFVKQKDFSTLVRAFHRIHHKIPHDLLILGQGPLENTIRALVKELSLEGRVILPGFLQNPFPLFHAASLFVLSSIYEGFGVVIIEALAAGTPVVSTNCPGGPKEILANGKYGILTPVGDDKALAEAINLALTKPLSAELLQKRAADFSLEKIACQYQDIFDNFN